MNYVLSINLEGADKADAQLDSLLSKMSKIGNLENIQMDKLVDESGILKSGEQAGDLLGNGIKKGVKKNLIGNWLGLTGELGVAIKKGIKDMAGADRFWNAAVKKGKSDSVKSLFRGYGIKSFSLPDVSQFLPKGKDTEKFGAMENLMRSGFQIPRVGFSEEENQRAKTAAEDSKFNDKLDKNRQNPPPILGDAKRTIKGIEVAFGILTTLFNPFVGSRVLSDAFAGHKSSAGKDDVEEGIFGGSKVFGSAGIFVFVESVKSTFKIVGKIVEEFGRTVENARQLYAKSLIGGMGIQFTAKRSLMAQIMGVSETDVFRFGAQMEYLNPRLELASSILAKTTVPLTQLSWELKILNTDFEALVALLYSEVSPFVMGLVKIFDDVVKGVIRLERVFVGFIEGLATGLSNVLLGQFGTILAKLGIYIVTLFGKSGGALPSPQAWMKQLPAGTWEKMGLVTGGGGRNYQKEIAKNTADMAAGFKAFANAFRGHGAGGTWGMSLNTANP
jgi:hypothetical protein